MDNSRLLLHPAKYLDRISNQISFTDEAEKVMALTEGREQIHEVFCRTGRLGSELMERGISWCGIDPDAEMVEYAIAKGREVQQGTHYPTGLVTCLVGWFGPLSLVPPDRLGVFARGVLVALAPGGVAFLESWLRPGDARQGYALMDTYDGLDCKLVRACVPRIEGDQAIFEFDWMVGVSGKPVRRETHKEIRYLHSDESILKAFSDARISLLEEGALRVWRVDAL